MLKLEFMYIWRLSMKNLFNDNVVREAAYYIWKNNGCPANTCSQDWNAALNQLSAMASLNSNIKASASKSTNSAVKIASVKSAASASKLTAVKTLNSAKKVAKSAK